MSLRTVNRTVSLLLRVMDPKKSTTPMVLTVPQKPPCRRLSVAQPFERVTPESQGIPSDTIAAFLRELQNDRTLNMHSVLLLRHGKVIAEAVFGDQDSGVWKMTFSACKSITALAVGMLIDEGKLTESTRVVDLFPDKTAPIARLKYKDLTVEHLLMMKSGAVFNEAAAMTETDWVRAFFANAPDTRVGQKFRYNSLNTYLLSAVVKRVSGQGLGDYLRERLFEPLGITEWFWETCPEGIEKGGWGLYIGNEDLAKIGQMVLQGGVWNGKRLLSEEWLQSATEFQATTPENYGAFNYGYQIWTGREKPRFLFNGMLGQNVLGFKDSGILLVTNAGNDEMFQQSRFFELAERYFGKEFEESLPEDVEAVERLRQTVAELVTHREKAGKPWWRRLFAAKEPALPSLCYWLDGKTFAAQKEDGAAVGLLPMVLQMVQNNYTAGLQSIAFSVEKDTLWMTYTEGEDAHRLAVGVDTAADGEVYVHGEPYRVRVRGRAATNEDGLDVLIVTVTFLETPCTRTLRLYFDGKCARLRQEETPGMPLVEMFRKETVDKLSEQPLMATAVEKLDDEYITYRIRRILTPEIVLESE